ncbi:sigma 54-interacting transcriptional regulator [Nitrospira sp. M1]
MNTPSIWSHLRNGYRLGFRRSFDQTEISFRPRSRWLEDASSETLRVHVNCVASSKQPVILWNEKDHNMTDIAKLIHQKSPFAEQQFVHVACRTNPFETWVRALSQFISPCQPNLQKRYNAQSSSLLGGTLFLDELECLPMDLQHVLYSMLDRDGIVRFTNHQVEDIEIRVVASSSTNIWRQCQEGLFQANLLSQLNRLAIHDVFHASSSPQLVEQRERIAQNNSALNLGT